jgi:hypothetical protein
MSTTREPTRSNLASVASMSLHKRHLWTVHPRPKQPRRRAARPHRAATGQRAGRSFRVQLG